MQNRLRELLDIIDSKVNIVDIVSDYVSLEKKGQNHVGLCPFHSDSNPSMSVSSSKNIFKCFSCGAGGNAITFVQNREGISFIDSVKKVSEKAGIDWRPYITEREIKIDPKILRGWEINREALNFFKYSLENASSNVKEYLNSRELTKDIIEKFNIGFSGDGSSLSNFLISKGFSEEEIISYGLAKRKEDTTLIDNFINRLMFTIEDINGNIVGFSGRVIDGNKNYAKYLNTPETILFKKSDILYNINKAKSFASLRRELIVVEGFMDVIALHKSGIDNVIATMGTAFTKSHHKMISSLTTNIVLAFDSDAPGINAAINTAKSLIPENFKVEVVSIPLGKDFDELFKSGAEIVASTLDNRKEFIEFYKDKLYPLMDNADGMKISELLDKFLETLSLYSDGIMIHQNILQIVERYKLPEEEVKSRLSKVTKPKVVEQPYVQPDYIPQDPLREAVKTNSKVIDDKNNRRNKFLFLEKLIIAYAMQNLEAKEYLEINLMQFLSAFHYRAWTDYSELSIESIEDKTIVNAINDMKTLDLSKEFESIALQVNNIEDFIHVLEMHKENFRTIRREDLRRSVDEATTDEDKRHYLKLLNDL